MGFYCQLERDKFLARSNSPGLKFKVPSIGATKPLASPKGSAVAKISLGRKASSWLHNNPLLVFM